MKKLIAIIVCFCITAGICSFSTNVAANDTHGNEELEYSANEIILLTEYYVSPEDYDANSIFHGVEIIGIESLFNNSTAEAVETYAVNSGNCFSYIITLPDGSDLDNSIDVLNNSSGIIAADKNYYIEIVWDEPVINNNARSENNSTYQWAIDEDHLNIEEVWSKGFTGSANTVVAVIDKGFDTAHEDVSFDLTQAYDCEDNDTNVNTYSSEYNKHGTGIAGIIGANTENNVGIKGVCKDITIVPIRSSSIDTHAQLTAVMNKAIEAGAKIINCSFSMDFELNILMLHALGSAGIMMIQTAGNWGDSATAGSRGFDLGSPSCSCAEGTRHNSSNVLVVGASTVNNQKWIGSNYSSVYCDLFAPGDNIYMTGNQGYFSDSGTSFAAPYVAAAYALIKSTATHLTVSEIREFLLDNVTPVSGLSNYCVSGGVLSITDAIDAIYDANRGAYTRGDVNGDGRITVADKNLCSQIAAGTYNPTAQQRNAADLNGDGAINAFDTIYMIQYCNKTFYFTP